MKNQYKDGIENENDACCAEIAVKSGTSTLLYIKKKPGQMVLAGSDNF